ncbi:MAG: sugar phosphate isomerase/epimerase [Kiritimatiellales bacterium]|nr:sugar phosphate isomerase/epimerase [Kiritimatiellales bacterium]
MPSRRIMIQSSAAVAGAAITTSIAKAAPKKSPFSYCLNMATIKGYELSLVEELEVAAKAGYTGVEPWTRKISEYQKSGGSLADLGKRIQDLGLTVEGAIGFTRWILDDDKKRAAGLEQMKGEMDALAQIGGKRIAAPPAGANKGEPLDLKKAAERYRALLEIGDETGVMPALEIWGPSATLHSLGEAAFVLAECDHPKANLLADTYHIYRGGGGFHGLKIFSADALQIYHMNDYPDIPRDKITDRDRVWPGDGIAPTKEILTDLASGHDKLVLSLELFNPNYWTTDALTTAKLGLDKMKTQVAMV